MSLGGEGAVGGWGRGAVGIFCHNRLAKCKSLTHEYVLGGGGGGGGHSFW